MSAPRLISVLHVGPHAIPVFECDEAWTDDDCDAECNFDPYWIKVAGRLQGPARWSAIVHELVHLALEVHGLRLGVYKGKWWQRVIDTLRGSLEWEEREELLCDLIAATLAQALGPALGEPPHSAPVPVSGWER